MADLVYPSDTLTPGNPNNVNDVKAIKTNTANYVNGSGWVDTARIADDAVTGAKLSSTAIGDSDQGDELGVNGASTVRRGKSIIATEESTTSASYTYLTTPDRVQNVVLPTDGLIFVLFHAAWQGTVAHAANAAVFVGSNQIRTWDQGNAASVGQAAEHASLGYSALISLPQGLGSIGANGSQPADVTTGQATGVSNPVSNQVSMNIGGSSVYDESTVAAGSPVMIFAAAGTYDIGVKFKASSGTVSAKNRKLWVWTCGF